MFTGQSIAKIWLIHTERFHKDIVSHLAEKGVQVSYVCSTPEQLEFLADIVPPDCILHSLWDTMLGILPSSPDKTTIDHIPPDASLLEQLSPYETTAIQMLERLNYQRLQVQDLKRYYLKYLSCWRGLINAFRPEAVVFQSTPHHGYDYVLYALCQVYGIKTLIVERTYLPNRLILIDRIDKMPTPKSLPDSEITNQRYQKGNIQGEAEAEEPSDPVEGQDNYYDARNCQYQLEGDRNIRKFKVQMLKGLIHSGKMIIGTLRSKYTELFKPVRISVYGLTNPQPRLITSLWHLIVDSIYRFSLMLFYEAHTEPPDLKQDYIYFPLHYQPEKSTIPMGGLFADQLLVLDILTHSLPPGWMVYVREHPRQFTDYFAPTIRLARNRLFYESLCLHDRNKVRIISLGESSNNLIRHSRCVATITGTTGWEAVELGVPAIVFGSPWFVNCPGVYRVSSVEECAAILKQFTVGRCQVIQAQVVSYVKWLASEGTFRGYFSDIWEKASGMTAAENARSYAEAIASIVI